MGVEVSRVDNVDAVWPSVEPMVQRGLRHGAGDSLTGDYLRESVRRGDMTMWAAHEGEDIIAVIVLALNVHPGKKTLSVVLVAGRDFHRWAGQVSGLVRDLAGIVGADTIEATARPGMARWLTRYGWQRKAVIMELSHGR